MADPYRTIATPGSVELEIKKSRFICHIARAGSEDDARAFIGDLKKRHWDANHNCSAYILGDRGEVQRTSDDGEPSGTAGVPMLTVLQKRGLTDTVAVVTRYFGGTKLGAGGLIRAYGQAVSRAVDAAGIVERRELERIAIDAAFEDAGRLENSLRGEGREPDDVAYGERVTMVLTLEPNEVDDVEAAIAEWTSGRATVARLETVHTLVPVTDGTDHPDERTTP